MDNDVKIAATNLVDLIQQALAENCQEQVHQAATLLANVTLPKLDSV